MIRHKMAFLVLSTELLICFACPPPIGAQTGQTAANKPPRPSPQATAGRQSAEQRTSLGLETARTNPLQLRAFLRNMPKGADLHNHLGGAIYAESLIRAGAEDGLCLNTATLSYVRPQTSPENAPPP